MEKNAASTLRTTARVKNIARALACTARDPWGPQFPVCVRKGLGFSQVQLNPSVGFPFVPARWTFVFFHWVWALGGPQFPVGATNKQT